MPYRHAGEIGDVWKHLPLCDILKVEKPKRYIETNSASPFYILSRKPELEYGIYNLVNNIEKSPVLIKSLYYKTLLSFNEKEIKRYLGSPGLAMTILKDIVNQYIFCDIEEEPLDEINRFADNLGIGNKVKTIHGDSIDFGFRFIPELNYDDFVFLDPYWPFDENETGYSFFDLFIVLAKTNIRCVLWYGYDTLNSKEKIVSFAKEKLDRIKLEKHSIKGVNMFLRVLQEDKVVFNPGVPGCGVLVANLSEQSVEKLLVFSEELQKFYKKVKYEGFDGELSREVIDF